jgi:hypothetical protein
MMYNTIYYYLAICPRPQSLTNHCQSANIAPSLAEQLQTLQTENVLLLERLGHAENRANARASLDF